MSSEGQQITVTVKARATIYTRSGGAFDTSKYNITDKGVFFVGDMVKSSHEVALPNKATTGKNLVAFIPFESIDWMLMDSADDETEASAG